MYLINWAYPILASLYNSCTRKWTTENEKTFFTCKGHLVSAIWRLTSPVTQFWWGQNSALQPPTKNRFKWFRWFHRNHSDVQEQFQDWMPTYSFGYRFDWMPSDAQFQTNFPNEGFMEKWKVKWHWKAFDDQLTEDLSEQDQSISVRKPFLRSRFQTLKFRATSCGSFLKRYERRSMWIKIHSSTASGPQVFIMHNLSFYQSLSNADWSKTLWQRNVLGRRTAIYQLVSTDFFEFVFLLDLKFIFFKSKT